MIEIAGFFRWPFESFRRKSKKWLFSFKSLELSSFRFSLLEVLRNSRQFQNSSLTFKSIPQYSTTISSFLNQKNSVFQWSSAGYNSKWDKLNSKTFSNISNISNILSPLLPALSLQKKQISFPSKWISNYRLCYDSSFLWFASVVSRNFPLERLKNWSGRFFNFPIWIKIILTKFERY